VPRTGRRIRSEVWRRRIWQKFLMAFFARREDGVQQ